MGGDKEKILQEFDKSNFSGHRGKREKWSRHGDGDGNSKTEYSEQMLPVCELGERQKMKQWLQRQEKPEYPILPSFFSFALSGMPVSDLKSRIFCSHEFRLRVAPCLNSCL